MNKVLFSKQSDDWATPTKLYKQYMDRGFIDPCPLKADFDGLKRAYPTGSKFFINPPYSNIAAFVDFAFQQLDQNGAKHIVFLVPSRTDTKWFQKILNRGGTSFMFIKGRLKFGDSNNSAPFPSVLISMKPIPEDEQFIINSCIGIDLKEVK